MDTKAKIALSFAALAIAIPAYSSVIRPIADTFVLEPGIANQLSYPDANSINFGGSGSQSVASPTARAYSLAESIDDEPKGEFIGLIKFDTASLEDTKILSLSLDLNIINGNEKAFGLFNVRGTAGFFDLYMISNDWKQGNGSPEGLDTTEEGITHNDLTELNEESEPVLVATFYYDAAHPHSDGGVWYSFDFDLTSPLFAVFADAAEDGDTVSFMMKASEGSDVAFNYMGYVQNTASEPILKSTGPKLTVEYCELQPADINKDCIVDLLDFAELCDHWLESSI